MEKSVRNFDVSYTDRHIIISYLFNNGNHDKTHEIIFVRNTTACKTVEQTIEHYFAMSVYDEYKGDNMYIAVIEHMRKSYDFKCNASNPCRFYPLSK